MTDRNKRALLTLGSFLAFAALAVLFPSTGDDWDWGTVIGLERLQTFFAGYNGRYLGNLLVLLLTRSRVLDVVLTALGCALVPVLCARFSRKGDATAQLLALAVLLLMPRGIFAQSVVWTAGFVNYVPPALITGWYLARLRKALEEPLEQKRGFATVSFCLGLAGALFMENMTVFHICLGIAGAALLWWQHKGLPRAWLSFPLGAVLGAGVMFANSGYRVIAQGEDFYRQTPKGLVDTVKFMAYNLQKILEFLILDNWAVCLAVMLLLMLLCRGRKQRGVRLWMALHYLATVAVLAGTPLLKLAETRALSDTLALAVRIAVTVVCAIPYVVTVFVVTWLAVDKSRRLGVLLSLVCVPVCLGPLLVVRPIGERCMFPGYVLLVLFAVALFDEVRREALPPSKQKLAALVLAAVAVLQLGNAFRVYVPGYLRQQTVAAYARHQSDAGAQVIAIADPAVEGYVHCSCPYNDIVWNRYCLFYGLNTDTTFTVLPWEELEALALEAGIR